VKRLLLDGANITRVTGKGLLPVHLARKHGHPAVALLIEFWESPTTNKRIEGVPNFDYNPRAAAERASTEHFHASKGIVAAKQQAVRRRTLLMPPQRRALSRQCRTVHPPCAQICFATACSSSIVVPR